MSAEKLKYDFDGETTKTPQPGTHKPGLSVN